MDFSPSNSSPAKEKNQTSQSGSLLVNDPCHLTQFIFFLIFLPLLHFEKPIGHLKD